MIGTATLNLPGPTGVDLGNPSVLTMGSERYTIFAPADAVGAASSGDIAVAVDGSTLVEGGPAATVAG